MAEAALSTIVLPEALGLRRGHVVAERHRVPDYDARYDFLTLVYDVVREPETGVVRLFCPKLTGLEAPLRAGLALDGERASVMAVRRFERYDVVELAPRPTAAELAVTIGGWTARVPVNACDRRTFAGRNVLLTLSKNNELGWIADWVRFHVRAHGADAVLFFDNGSAAYGPAEIEATLAGIDGIGPVVVIGTDRPYGAPGRKPKRFVANFLQAALLNIARHRFLMPARAVLQCDVDELVVGPGSIFDATVASRHGFVRFAGEWRYPPAATGGPVRHADHVFRNPAGGECPPKYCIVPSGPMRHKSWATHGLAGLWFGRRYVSPEFRFLHCHGISDFWKGRPRPPEAAAAVRDEATARLLEAVVA